MKQKYYLIDTENVGDRWTSYIEDLHEEEILIVFYSKNHSKLLEEIYLEQRYNQQIRWIECITGSNALDYQLIGVLSYLIATHTDASYAIFSNDNDYQNIIEFWEERNIRIDRVGFSLDKKKTKKDNPKNVSNTIPNTTANVPDNQPESLPSSPVTKPPKTEPEKTQPQKTEPPESTPETLQDTLLSHINTDADNKPFDNEPLNNNQLDNKQLDNEQLLKIAKTVPVSNLSGWYAVLTILMGQEKGRTYYAQIKENQELRAKLSQYLLPDVHNRNIYLIRILYQHNHLDASQAEAAYKIIRAHNIKNKKAIHADFDKKFGKKISEHAQYYKAVKPILSVLKGKK